MGDRSDLITTWWYVLKTDVLGVICQVHLYQHAVTGVNKPTTHSIFLHFNRINFIKIRAFLNFSTKLTIIQLKHTNSKAHLDGTSKYMYEVSFYAATMWYGLLTSSASITVATPTVNAIVGTLLKSPPKNRAFARIVSWARVFTLVRDTRLDPGSLKAMWPSGPIPVTKYMYIQ